jgi:putative IMPACT (imprinted ancient) family translation regulator
MKLKVNRTILQLTYDHTYDGNISRLLKRYNVEDIVPDYTHKIQLTIAIASSELIAFRTELTNITSNNVEVFLPASE